MKKSLRSLWLTAMMAGIGMLVMSLTLLRALLFGDLAAEGRVLMEMPWGLMSLVDIYTGLLLFACWVFWRERYVTVGMLWLVGLLLLGNLASCLYILVAVLRSQGNLERFIHGHRISVPDVIYSVDQKSDMKTSRHLHMTGISSTPKP